MYVHQKLIKFTNGELIEQFIIYVIYTLPRGPWWHASPLVIKVERAFASILVLKVSKN